MTASHLASAHMTSATFRGRDGFEAFRETYGRAVMQLEIEPHPDHPFALDFHIRGIPGFSLAGGLLSPTRNRHTPAMIDNDDVILVHTVAGRGALHQFGRTAELGAGEAAFTSNGEVGVFDGHLPSRLLNFRFSRAMLAESCVDLESALVRPIPREAPALRLLTHYAGIMGDGQALAAPELAAAVVGHMHALAALLLGPRRTAAEGSGRQAVRAARLRAIKDDIERELAAPGLTAAAMAVRHGISERTLRDLFRDAQTTFTNHVLERRLARAYRRLDDPADTRTISAIAFDCGFGDLSYFNHSFRRRFGAIPSDVRAAARRRAP